MLLWSAIAFSLAALAGALVVDGWPAQRFLALYVAPLFLVAPLWVRLRVEESWPPRGAGPWLDATVFLLSLLRFVLGEVLPFSGHTLFLTYSAMTTRQPWYRWLAILLFAETTVFKLGLWHDVHSWGLGIALGVLAALAHAQVRARSSGRA